MGLIPLKDEEVRELGLEEPKLVPLSEDEVIELGLDGEELTPEEVEFKGLEKPESDDSESGYGSQLFYQMASGSAGIGAGIARLPAVLYEIAAFPQNVIVSALGRRDLETKPPEWLANNPISEYYDNQAKLLNQVNEKYDDSISGYFEKGEYGKAAKVLGLQVAENIPLQISLLLGGAIGAGAQTLAAAGGISAAQQQKDISDKDIDLPQYIKTLNIATNGLAEAAFESLGTVGLAEISAKLIKKVGKQEAEKIVQKGIKAALKRSIEKHLPIIAPIDEGLEEYATQVAQNLNDIATGVDENKNPLDGAMDAFLVGMVSSGMTTVPGHIAGVQLEKLENKKEDTTDKNKTTSGELDVDNQINYDALSKLGYSEADMSDMTVKQAQDIIRNATPKQAEQTQADPTQTTPEAEKPAEAVTEPQTGAGKVGEFEPSIKTNTEKAEVAKIREGEITAEEQRTEFLKKNKEKVLAQIREVTEDDEHADVVTKLVAVNAKVWAKNTGRPEDEYYSGANIKKGWGSHYDNVLNQGNKRYYRRSDSPSGKRDVDWQMFADDRGRVEKYGEYEFYTDDSDAIDANDLIDEVEQVFKEHPEVLDEYGVSARELAESINPDDIVESAGLWDNVELVDFLWDNYLEQKGIEKIKTDNGIVVLDEFDKHIRKSDDVLNQEVKTLDIKKEDIAGISKKQWAKINTIMKRKGYDWRGADDAKELVTKMLNKSSRVTNDVRDAINTVLERNLSTDEKSVKKRINEAKKGFGTTTNFKEAGYLLVDGSMLDFSGKREGGMPGSRAYDHREIGMHVEDNPGGYDGMIAFMRDGNIRMQESGADISRMPTDKQIAKLKQHIRINDGEYYVDLENGDDKISIEYNKGTNPNKIIKDITDFYSKRKVQPASKVAKFHNQTLYQEGQKQNAQWYSKLQKLIEAKMPNKADPQTIKNIIAKGGVKQEEIEYSGLNDFLEGKKTVTKDELLNHLIENQPLFQSEVKGAIELKKNGEALIHILENADKSTIIHELVHYAIHKGILNDIDSKILLDWAGQKEWNRTAHEKVARGVERWMRKGHAPTEELQSVFDKLKKWFHEIYKVIKGSDIDIKLNRDVEDVFRVMFGGEKIGHEVKKNKNYQKSKPINTVGDWVKSRMNDIGKGIKPNHLREHGINQKENSGVFLKYARKNGLGLDEWAATAQAEGIIPGSVDAEEYFVDALLENKPIASEITLEQEDQFAQQEQEYYYNLALEEGAIPEDMTFEEFTSFSDDVDSEISTSNLDDDFDLFQATDKKTLKSILSKEIHKFILDNTEYIGYLKRKQAIQNEDYDYNESDLKELGLEHLINENDVSVLSQYEDDVINYYLKKLKPLEYDVDESIKDLAARIETEIEGSLDDKKYDVSVLTGSAASSRSRYLDIRIEDNETGELFQYEIRFSDHEDRHYSGNRVTVSYTDDPKAIDALIERLTNNYTTTLFQESKPIQTELFSDELKKKAKEKGIDLDKIAKIKNEQLSFKFETATESEKELARAYWKQLNRWFGNKDVRKLEAEAEKRMLQKAIKEYTGSKRYGNKEKDLDRAIQIYLDTKRDPEAVSKYYDDLTDEQKRIVDLSKKLPKAIKDVADKIRKSYDEIGLEARDMDVIRNVLDNYAARIWKLEGKTISEKMRHFGTTTRHAKERKIMTIIEGWAKGYELAVEGATNNLEILKSEISNTIEDKRFIKALQRIKTIDGEPLLTTQQLPGYVEVKHPNFTTWKYAGKVEEGKTYGRNFFQDKEGNLFEKRRLYAPEKQAKNLNNILGTSGLMDVPGIKTITKYNAIIKSWILQSSFFHHLAFMRSYYLGTRHKTWKEMNIRQMYREGVRLIEQQAPIVRHLVRNGLTLGLRQDWNEQLLHEKTIIGKIIDNIPGGKEVKDKILELRDRQADFLFGEFGAGLKVKAAIIEYRNILKENPDMDVNEAARLAANLINDDFGGLHLGRIGRNPTLQHLFRLLALAPDWTESNIRTMVKMFKRGAEGKLYRRFWAGILTKGIAMTVIANMLMAGLDDDDDEAKGWLERFKRNYKKAYKSNRMRFLDVDITPLYKYVYRMLGKEPTGRRKYFPILGHFKDPIKFLFGEKTKGGYPDIVRSLIVSMKHKGSVVFNMIFEALVGTDWANRRYTTFDELIGKDTDKGYYKTSSKKYGYKKGDPKFGKLKGQTVTWGGGKMGPIGVEQLPSYLLAQLKGSQPVQIQNLIAWYSGEMEGFDAIGNSLGLGVRTTYEGKGEKEYKRLLGIANELDKDNAEKVFTENKQRFIRLLSEDKNEDKAKYLIKLEKKFNKKGKDFDEFLNNAFVYGIISSDTYEKYILLKEE